MITETIKPVMYSYRWCPKGWSLSEGKLASLKPINVITELPASAKLLIPSAIIAILCIINPKTIFKAHKKKFDIIPTTPHILPYANLTFGLSTSL